MRSPYCARPRYLRSAVLCLCKPHRVSGCAGINDALSDAMRHGPGPLAHAAVDVLHHLLLNCRRLNHSDDTAPFSALPEGPTLLAGIGEEALKQGALSHVMLTCLIATCNRSTQPLNLRSEQDIQTPWR